MAHTLIQIQSHLFIISQPKVSFQFLNFKESSYMVFTSTYHYFFKSSLTFWDCKWDPLPLSLEVRLVVAWNVEIYFVESQKGIIAD